MNLFNKELLNRQKKRKKFSFKFYLFSFEIDLFLFVEDNLKFVLIYQLSKDEL